MRYSKVRLSVVSVLSLVTLAASTAKALTGPAQNLPAQDSKQVARAGEAPAKSKAPSAVSQQYEKEGVVIDFSMSSIKADNGEDAGLIAGANANVSFRVTDRKTGEPVRGLRPSAWIDSRASGRAPGEEDCKDKIRSFLAGRLSARAEIDLNSYHLLTLNHDATVTFINPQVSFNVSKLESIVVLPGVGSDWVHSKDGGYLYVTVPDRSVVAVINTTTRRLVGTISTGEKTKPVRIALQPDGRQVWVGLDDSPAVAVIDAASNRLVKTVTAGAGLHLFAFSPDSRFAYVTNSAADTVSVIDARTLSKVSDITVGKTPVPVAYSPAANSVYVAAINGGTISVINPERQRVVKTINIGRGVVALKFDPTGRYAFAVNQVESIVTVIDSSNDRVVAESEVVKGPDQIAFTPGYAYVRGTDSEKFSLLEMKEIRAGRLEPVNIQAGRLAASTSPEDIGVADMIQPTPEGNSVMVANAPDQMIYYYVEGMMAPMGSFQNYKRRARALMLVDHSLAETAPGVYSTTVRLTKPGTFDVPVIIDQPRMVNCFEARVGGSPLAEKVRTETATVVEPLFKGNRYKPGEPVTLRFKIIDPVTKQPLTGLQDVQVLIFEPPGIWQRRAWAKEVGGAYEVAQAFPHAGLFRVMTQINSRGLRYADLPHTDVPVINPTGGGDKDGKEQ